VEAVFLAAALALLATLIANLVRIARGPTEPDRMMAAQIFGTTGIAILLLLSRVTSGSLLDVALVFAPLAAIASVAFVRRTRQAPQGSGGAEE
jgi:multicomponent Na+:H+ antiporter subunit F